MTANSGINPTIGADLDRLLLTVGQAHHVIEEAIVLIP